jgi:hypothetical protein
MILLKLLKAVSILGMVLLQWGVVILNLNQYGLFQSFVNIEWFEVHPTQEDAVTVHEPNLFI